MNNIEDLKKNIAEALSILLKSGMIDQTQCNVLAGYYSKELMKENIDEQTILMELGNLFRKPGFVEQKLSEILNSKIISGDTNVSASPIPEPINSTPVSSVASNDDVEIVDIGFDEQAQFDGITPTDMNSIGEYEGEGRAKGRQKVLTSHTGIHFGEDNGFMTFLFVMFLAGISSGIIFMIVLNFLAK